MGVNRLPKTVTRQHRGCNVNPDPTAPESSTLTTRLPSHQLQLLPQPKSLMEQSVAAQNRQKHNTNIQHSQLL